MIGVGHLQPAVIGLDLAGDQALFSDGEKALQVSGIGLEIDELERAGRVLHQYLVRRPSAPPPAARPMLGDSHFEGRERADLSFRDRRHDRPIDEAHRQVPQKVDGPRMGPGKPWSHQFIEQPLDSRADAFQGADRGEEGGKPGWAHGGRSTASCGRRP
jgi:hypothetical protein